MEIAAAISTHPVAPRAVGEAVGDLLDRLGPAPDAALVFVTPPFGGVLEDVAATVRALLRPRALVGAVVAQLGTGTFSSGPTVSLVGLRANGAVPALPGCRALVLADPHDEGTPRGVPGPLATAGVLIAIADPFGDPLDALLGDLGASAPDLSVVGGLASAPGLEGPAGLIADDRLLDRGAVGLLLPAGTGAGAVISDGWRALGAPIVATRTSGTMVLELDGAAAIEVVRRAAGSLPAPERRRIGQALHLVAVGEDAASEAQRAATPVLGVERATGAIAVAGPIEEGSLVQLLLVDDLAGADELRRALGSAPITGGVAFAPMHGGDLRPAEDRVRALADHLTPGAFVAVGCPGTIGPGPGGPHLRGAATVLLTAEPVRRR